MVDNPADPRYEWVARLPVAIWDLLHGGAVAAASLPPSLTLRPASSFPPLEEVVRPGRPARQPAADYADAGHRGRHHPGGARPRRQRPPDAPRVDRRCARTGHAGARGPARRRGLAAARTAGGTRRCPGRHRGRRPLLARPAGFRPSPRSAATRRSRSCSGWSPGAPGDWPGPPSRAPCRSPWTAVTLAAGARLWLDGGLRAAPADLAEITERFLLTPGNIRRAVPLAHAVAASQGRDEVAARGRPGRRRIPQPPGP